MPWRNTRDPYCIWLSEIMLQQTQVATVIPYYERFLAKFPTVNALAAAHQDDVLKLWSGLGYYSRARNLHRGAQLVAGRFGGKVPDSAELIREVPGIGQYTAGAVLSIAFGKAEPLVDGNVARVLSRLFLIKGDYRNTSGKENVWTVARELVAAVPRYGDPGDYNQALMELGATLCSPRSPACDQCPLAKHCLANKGGLQQAFPELAERKASPTWKLRAWVVEDEKGRVLFAQRHSSGLFGGLWEVPTERIQKTEKSARVHTSKRIKHVLTHRVLDIEIKHSPHAGWHARETAPELFACWSGNYTQYRWLPVDAARSGKEIALSSVQQAILRGWSERK